MIHFACPGCGASYSVEDAKAGKASKCRKCQAQFLIPVPDPNAPPPPPGAPPAPPPVAPPPDVGVEIVPCPGCQSRLTVAPSDLGRNIECPHCRTVYAAVRPGALLPGMAPGSRLSMPPLPGQPPPPVYNAEDAAPPPPLRERNLWPEEALALPDAPPPPPKRSRFRRQRSVGGTRTVTSLGVLSVAKMSGAISFIFSLLGALLYAVLGLIVYLVGTAAVGGPMQTRGAGAGVAGIGILYFVCVLVVFPFIYGVMGFIGGALFALAYNLLATVIGGVEIDLE